MLHIASRCSQLLAVRTVHSDLAAHDAAPYILLRHAGSPQLGLTTGILLTVVTRHHTPAQLHSITSAPYEDVQRAASTVAWARVDISVGTWAAAVPNSACVLREGASLYMHSFGRVVGGGGAEASSYCSL